MRETTHLRDEGIESTAVLPELDAMRHDKARQREHRAPDDDPVAGCE